MDKYVCPCGYEYDPELGDPDNGIQPGTRFEDLPEDWVCPVCGLSKDEFERNDGLKHHFRKKDTGRGNNSCGRSFIAAGAKPRPNYLLFD